MAFVRATAPLPVRLVVVPPPRPVVGSVVIPSPAPFLGQKQVSASGRVVVSDLEGFVLFFEQTGQLLDRPSTAGQVGRQLR
jgi:hypothetical protein